MYRTTFTISAKPIFRFLMSSTGLNRLQGHCKEVQPSRVCNFVIVAVHQGRFVPDVEPEETQQGGLQRW